jgi:hypothetical protein
MSTLADKFTGEVSVVAGPLCVLAARAAGSSDTVASPSVTITAEILRLLIGNFMLAPVPI